MWTCSEIHTPRTCSIEAVRFSLLLFWGGKKNPKCDMAVCQLCSGTKCIRVFYQGAIASIQWSHKPRDLSCQFKPLFHFLHLMPVAFLFGIRSAI